MALSPAEVRRQGYTYLRDIRTHETIACWGQTPVWSSIREQLELDGKAHRMDSVDVVETDEGDYLTVEGEPVAYLDRGFTDRLAIQNAAFPVQFLQAAE